MNKQRILADFIAAYKAGDKIKKDCLGGIKTEITKWETSKQNAGKFISHNDIIQILTSEAKKRRDAISLYEQEGSETALNNADKERQELEIIQSYLPEQLSEEKILEIAEIVIAGNVHKQSFGDVMKHFSTNYKGQYDPAVLKSVTEKLLEQVNG